MIKKRPEKPLRGLLDAMRLDLRFTARPLEELWCESLVALTFEGGLEEQEVIAGLDRNTSGSLSILREKGFWPGSEGETLLLIPRDMANAEKILLKGLGARSGYDARRLEEISLSTGNTLAGMGISDVGIRIPPVQEEEGDYNDHVISACVNLVRPFQVRYARDNAYVLRVIVSVPLEHIRILEERLETLRTSFQGLEHSIVIEGSRTPVCGSFPGNSPSNISGNETFRKERLFSGRENEIPFRRDSFA